MRPFILLLAVVTLSVAQKAHKAGPYGGGGGGGGKQAGSVQSYPAENPSHNKAYSQHGGAYQGFAGTGAGQYGGAATGAKPTYPQLLQDSRQLNQDGTINFQYAADNGLQQGETVDPDGTRRGFYSYPGADGKPLTVKYTAGKNGFVAEGAHLPRQPNVAAPQTKDEVVARPQHHGGHGGGDSGAYYGGAPNHYSAAHNPGHGHGGPAPYQHNQNQYNARPAYNPPSPYYDPQAARSAFGGQYQGAPQAQYQGAPQTQYSQALPSQGRYQGGFQGPRPGGGFGGGAGGAMHSHINPYTPVGPAGPYQGQFDLGNGGTFSINFEPGQTQEVAYGGQNGQALGGPQQRDY